VLHGYNENFGLISFPVIALLFLKYCLYTVLITIVAALVHRRMERIFVFSLLLLVVFFFYGAVQDWLSAFAGKFFYSYKFLLTLVVIVIVTASWLIKKWRVPVRAVRFFRLLLIVLTALELLVLGYKFLKSDKQSLAYASKQVPLTSLDSCSTRPDIYFIVFDGFTSTAALKSEFAFDNSALDSVLAENGFFVSSGSASNYNVTPFSLASTLNMEYLQPGLEDENISSKRFLKGIETLRQSRLPHFLAQHQYKVINYGCFDLEDSKTATRPYFYETYASQVDNQTLFSRLKRDLGWIIATRFLITGKFRVPGYYNESKNYHLYRNRYNYEAVLGELQRSEPAPRFVYAHLMLPHEPFYLDAAGQPNSDTAIIKGTINNRSAYVGQVQYASKLISAIAAQARQPGTRPRVVIIEGDHGYRLFEEGADRRKEFPNLNAYYFTGQDYSRLYDGISPVNSFRVVFNQYFCQDLPMLRDSSIYLVNNNDIR
jgi:hypothetical protein